MGARPLGVHASPSRRRRASTRRVALALVRGAVAEGARPGLPARRRQRDARRARPPSRIAAARRARAAGAGAAAGAPRARATACFVTGTPRRRRPRPDPRGAARRPPAASPRGRASRPGRRSRAWPGPAPASTSRTGSLADLRPRPRGLAGRGRARRSTRVPAAARASPRPAARLGLDPERLAPRRGRGLRAPLHGPPGRARRRGPRGGASGSPVTEIGRITDRRGACASSGGRCGRASAGGWSHFGPR